MKLKKLICCAAAVLTAALGCAAFTAGAEGKGVRGDANLDGKANVRDVAYIARQLALRKGELLPETSDYNLDGVRNVSDAASLARAIALSSVQTYESRSVLSGIHCGMNVDEVMDVMMAGPDYSYANVLNPGCRCYIFNVYSVPELGVELKTDIHLSFNEDNILYNYGYHIGRESGSVDTVLYPYDIETLRKCYDDVYERLRGLYGNGKETKTGIYKTGRERLWSGTDYGDVWMVCGDEMWYEHSYIREILISCYDKRYEPEIIYPGK